MVEKKNIIFNQMFIVFIYKSRLGMIVAFLLIISFNQSLLCSPIVKLKTSIQ